MIRRLELAPCALGENALWHRESGEFVFTDILKGTLWAVKPGDGAPRLLAECRYETGAFLFDGGGDVLLLTCAGVFRCTYATGFIEYDHPLWRVPMLPTERFNDAICDAEGRILAGTKTDANTQGSLWLLEAGREPVRLLRGLKISNGMGFSPDGSTLYHTDSGDRTIYRYDYAPGVQSLTGGAPLVTLTGAIGDVPDGMTVDREGNLWTACWGGGCVRVFAPDGALLGEHPMPSTQVSSVCFGGDDLSALMVTSAAIGSSDPNDGGIYLADGLSMAGREEFRAVCPVTC